MSVQDLSGWGTRGLRKDPGVAFSAQAGRGGVSSRAWLHLKEEEWAIKSSW